MKSKKVLHIIDNLGLGGAQTMLKGIFEYDSMNKDIYLYSLRVKNKNLIINHPNLSISKYSKFSFKPLFELKRIIKEHQIEVLHCHLLKSQLFGWLVKKIWFKNITLIFHEHGQIVGTEHNNKLEDLFFILFIKLSKKDVQYFIAVSKFIEERLISRGNISINKIKLIYNYVDLSKFNKERLDELNKQNSKENLSYDENKFVIGYAGRLVERKGWKDFFKAALLLSKNTNYENLRFVIAGDGKDREELISQISLHGLQDKMKYLGHVSDMMSFYGRLNCFVMPSYWEGLPMAQLEVLALGIPLIATNAPGVNEIATNNISCLYIEPKNHIDIVENIIKIYKDTKLRNLLSRSGIQEVSKYSLINYMDKLKELYI